MSLLWSHGSSSVKRRQAPACSSRSSYLAEEVIKLKKVGEPMSSSMENQKKRLLPGNNGVAPKTTAYLRSPSNGKDIGLLGKTKGSRNSEGIPNLECRKGKLGGARERSSCASESSTSDKNRCSKLPFMSFLKSKIDAAGSVLGKTKKRRVKQVSEANCFYRERSFSDMPAVGDDYDAVECDLISCEQDLSELNLLPEEFLPWKPTNHWASTPKSCQTFNVGEFHAFDGSRLSPMEEASLVLEDPPANNIDKEEQSEYSRKACEEIIQVHDDNVDSMLALKLANTQFCDPWDQSISEEWSSFDKSTASGSISGESCFNSSCTSSSFESLSIQANLGDLNSFSLHWECDKIACSDLQELDLGNSLNEMTVCLFENEANKVAEELVAKAVKSVDHSKSCSFDDTYFCKYNERRSSFFALEQSLLQLDDINGDSSHEPLFWPFNPNSYFSDKYNFESSLYKIDSNCKAETSSLEGLNSNPHQSNLCNVSKKNSDGHSSASKETPPKDRACDLKEQTAADKSISSMSKASKLEGLDLLSDDNSLIKNISTRVSRKLLTDSNARRLGENISSGHVKSINGSMCSNNYLSSPNNNWKVIADQAPVNFPEMETECFERADASIEFLLGMKEFDGQEGLQATVNEEQGDQDLGLEDCVCTYGQIHSCGRSDLIYNSKLPIINLEQDFRNLQINPKYKATKGLLNTGDQDCNVIIEDKFENVERPVCSAMENRFIEEFQGTAKSLQSTSACILDEGMVGTDLDKSKEIEKIKTVMYMDHDNNPIGYPLRTTVISFPEKKLKSVEYNSQDAKSLAPPEEVGMEGKVEALEAELLEVRMQNKKLERLLKCVVRKTNTMEQSLHDRKLCLYGRRPVFCKCALHQRRKSGNKHQKKELFCINL